MTQPDSSPAVLDRSPDPADPQCDMCPHPSSAHDRIGARFCAASRASARTDRGCVCRH